MNPISDTAYYTCGIRAHDAQQERPLCGDVFAQKFMTERGLAICSDLKTDVSASRSIAVRHRMIDDFLRAELLRHPKTKVLLIGAGFDARAFRLNAGVWFEIDEPQVINHKNHCLPEQGSPNPLTRIAIDFSAETLASKLPANADNSPVIVVMEGVFGYLSEAQIQQTLQALRGAYPRHQLICDLMSKYFIESRGKKLTDKIEKLGAKFQFFPEDPKDIFELAGYQRTSNASIITETLQAANQTFLMVLVKTFFKRVMHGYTMNIFEMK